MQTSGGDMQGLGSVNSPKEPAESVAGQPRRFRQKVWTALTILVLLLAGAWAAWLVHYYSTPLPNEQIQNNQINAETKQLAPGALQLDPNKNYGNKYANGLLPVGDGHYTTSAPKAGYMYACSQYAQSLGRGEGGAQVRGPWFTNGNTQYDITKKPHVLGNVTWQADFTNTLSGDTRTIVTNDLPSHTTGVFPIARTDPAYQYDHNPNTITGQALTFALAANPAYSKTPNCIGGTVGVMLTGVVLDNAFDASGRDAGAWELQDGCSGHPQNKGEYHYHTLSSCIKDSSIHTVIGYALDGFPITGPQIGSSNVLATGDLDECHGITGSYYVNGKSVNGYHYVMTQDFPYSISCFRGTPITPPGQPTGPPPKP